MVRPRARSPAVSKDDVEIVAAAAHRAWCQRMRREGWRAGKRYNPSARTHDALVPFAKLSAVDRKNVQLDAAVILEQAGSQIDYPRGANRELTPGEMREGLRVGWSPGIILKDPPGDASTETGTVIGWKADPGTGLLKLVRVRWDKGVVTRHYPPERELRRLDGG